MASFTFNVAKANFAKGDLAWDSTLIKAMLVVGTVPAAATGADYDTIDACTSGAFDEHSDSGREIVCAASGTVGVVTTDDPNNYVVLDHPTGSGEGQGYIQYDTVAADAGTDAMAGVIIYDASIDTNDTTRIPIAYLEFSDTTIETNGGNVKVTWSSNGLIRLT